MLAAYPPLRSAATEALGEQNSVSFKMRNIISAVGNLLRRTTNKLGNAYERFFTWLRPRRSKVAFLTVQVIAIVFVILGWYLDHTDQSEWIAEVFAPRYAPAVELCNLMYENLGLEVNRTTPGFSEISSVLSEQLAGQLPNLGGFDIAGIEVVGMTAMAINLDPNRSGPRITLSIIIEDSRVLSEVEIPRNWLQSEIERRFLEEPLFRWGERLQWLGIIITFFVLIVEKVSELT
jgi:hypothetical protein